MEQRDFLCEEKLQKLLDICNQLSVGFHVKANDVEIARFDQGAVSEIYRIDFKNSSKKCIINGQETKRIVVKLFRPDPPYDVTKSKINSIIVGLEHLGPEVYLNNDNALVLKYIDGRPFTNQDDKNEEFVRLLANKLARFHSLRVPIPKNLYLDQIRYVFEEWMNETMWHEIYHGRLREALERNNCFNLINHNIEKEGHHLKENILAMNPNIVFAHQDLNHSNIFLINDSTSQPDIQFIDFDYTGYNFRAMDIGRYFADCEKHEQFANEGIISDDKMLRFISFYIEENCRIYGDHYRTDEKNSAEELLKESKLFVLFAQMVDIFFCIWTAVIKNPDERDEYCIRAEQRYSEYLDFKNRIQKENILN